MNLSEVLDYHTVFEKDRRLNVWHMALLTAILRLGQKQGQKHIIRVSRNKIMELSHVNTLPTYHKYFKELQILGYIKYTPSLIQAE